jgi:hypothetical protein
MKRYAAAECIERGTIFVALVRFIAHLQNNECFAALHKPECKLKSVELIL